MSQETLSEAPQNTQEKTNSDAFDSAEYVSESFDKHDVVDTDGVTRPAYTINGHEVVFRTRQESPTYEDNEVVVPGGKDVYPLERLQYDEVSNSQKMTDESAVRKYVDAHQENASRIVVTNTPEGMLSAAALLVESDEDRKELQELAEAFAKGITWTEAQKGAIDTMLAAVSVSDEGKLKSSLDMEGWPLALAALSGDMEARVMIDAKRDGLIEAEHERASDPNMPNEVAEYQAEKGIEVGEPIPLEQLALVHSTSYDIQRDEDGNIILRPNGQLRDDRYPRASLHFTLNSRVGDMTANGQLQKWSDANKLIVANFKDAVDESRLLPNRVAGMDTWFTLNPGEALKLPGALVVEQVEQTASGKVIEQTETGVEYVVKDDYTDEEKQSLTELSYKYGVTNPKDIALRMAMDQVGVPVDLMDAPSDDGHGMHSGELNKRVEATATGLGLPSGQHFGSPEAYMEDKAFFNMPKMLGKLAMDPGSARLEFMGGFAETAIESRRQAIASGFYPARPNVVDEVSAKRYSGSGI